MFHLLDQSMVYLTDPPILCVQIVSSNVLTQSSQQPAKLDTKKIEEFRPPEP